MGGEDLPDVITDEIPSAKPDANEDKEDSWDDFVNPFKNRDSDSKREGSHSSEDKGAGGLVNKRMFDDDDSDEEEKKPKRFQMSNYHANLVVSSIVGFLGASLVAATMGTPNDFHV